MSKCLFGAIKRKKIVIMIYLQLNLIQFEIVFFFFKFHTTCPAGNRMSKRNQKDTGYDIQNSCLFEIRNDIIC